MGDLGSLSSCHSDIGIPINYKRSQASSSFEAWNSACLSRCQRDFRPLVEMRWRGRFFSRVSTSDSDIPSSCEIKGKPAFQSLQGVRLLSSQGISVSIHLTQQTQGPSHIPIAARSLLLMCLWKVGIPLESKPGNQLSSFDDLG